MSLTHTSSHANKCTHIQKHQQRFALHTPIQIMTLTPAPMCRGKHNITPTLNSITHTVPTVVHSLLTPLCSMRWHPWMICTSGKLLVLFRREYTRSVSHVCHVVHHGGHLTKQHISYFFFSFFAQNLFFCSGPFKSGSLIVRYAHTQDSFSKAKCFIQLYPAFKAHAFFSSNSV